MNQDVDQVASEIANGDDEVLDGLFMNQDQDGEDGQKVSQEAGFQADHGSIASQMSKDLESVFGIDGNDLTHVSISPSVLGIVFDKDLLSEDVRFSLDEKANELEQTDSFSRFSIFAEDTMGVVTLNLNF